MLSDREETLFARYLAALLARNQLVNLTAITDPVEVAMKHFVDSLTVESLWHPRPEERAIDIGTGAGLPGLPLAIRYPEVAMVLNDSVRKKVDFLQETAQELQLPNVVALWARAETLGRDPAHRGQYDVALARAVSHIGALVEYALPLLKVGGTLIAMKGPGGDTELEEGAQAIRQLGGTVGEIRRFQLAGVGQRLLIPIRKAKPTPEIYPRDPGVAKKKPLYLDSRKRTP